MLHVSFQNDNAWILPAQSGHIFIHMLKCKHIKLKRYWIYGWTYSPYPEEYM